MEVRGLGRLSIDGAAGCPVRNIAGFDFEKPSKDDDISPQTLTVAKNRNRMPIVTIMSLSIVAGLLKHSQESPLLGRLN